MKRIFLIITCLFTLAACSGKNTAATAGENVTAGSETVSAPEETVQSGKYICDITVKDYGTITVELDGETAPVTVENFVGLARDGFYDGLTFHRIMDGFMIQGGSPYGDGTGGSGTYIKGEFASNGVENNISHVAGVISMARATPPDSASSQFFIMVGDATYLDGNYAGFGHVTEGFDIVQKIAADAKPVDDNGTIPKEEQPVIESIKVRE